MAKKKKKIKIKSGSKKRKIGKKLINILPFSRKGPYDEYKKRMMEIITRFFDEELGILVDSVKDIVNMKKKFKVMTWHLALLFAGLTIFLYGIGMYIDSICPDLGRGFSFMLVGILAVVIALVYKQMY